MEFVFDYNYNTGRNERKISISSSEYFAILPGVKYRLRNVAKRVDYYRGIHESGEATEWQQNALFELEGVQEELENFIDFEEKINIYFK